METFFSVPELVTKSSQAFTNSEGRFEIWTYDQQFIYANAYKFFLNNAESVGWRYVIGGFSNESHQTTLPKAASLEEYFKLPDAEFSYLMTEKNAHELNSVIEALQSIGKKTLYILFREQDTLRLSLKDIYSAVEKYPDFRLMFSYDHGVLLGLVYGKPIVPPKRAVIEIHDDCNLKCDFCWTHSPLLDEEASKKRKRALDVNLFYKYVDELASAPVELVELCAVGDPLYHPNVWEMIHYIKQKGLRVRVSTNGTLINKKNAEDIIRWGVDELAMNISGGDPETYKDIHNVSGKLFENLKKNLSYLAEMRKSTEGSTLLMNHVNVLTEKNARAIPGMLRFAAMTGANSVSFRAVWPHRAFLKQLEFSTATMLYLLNEMPLYEKIAQEIGIEHNLEFFKEELLSVAERRGIGIPPFAPVQEKPYNVSSPQFDTIPEIVRDNYKMGVKDLDAGWIQKEFASAVDSKLFEQTMGFKEAEDVQNSTQPTCAVGYHFTLLGSDNNLRYCCRGDKVTEKYTSIKEQWSGVRYQSFRASWRQAYKDKKSLCVGCPHLEENHRYSVLLHQHGLEPKFKSDV